MIPSGMSCRLMGAFPGFLEDILLAECVVVGGGSGLCCVPVGWVVQCGCQRCVCCVCFLLSLVVLSTGMALAWLSKQTCCRPCGCLCTVWWQVMVLIVRCCCCCCCYDEPWERYRPCKGRHDTQHTTMDPTEQHASTNHPATICCTLRFCMFFLVNLHMLRLFQLPVG